MRRLEETLMFLPGASGNVRFWEPVSQKRRHPGARRFVAWPGFGGVPAEPTVRGIRASNALGHLGRNRRRLARGARTGGPHSVSAIVDGRPGSPTSAKTSPSGSARSPFLCSSCGETRTRSVPWRSGGGSQLFPRAELVVFAGGTHDLVLERADEVARHIE